MRHRRVRDAALLLGMGVVGAGLVRTEWPWRELAPRAIDAVAIVFTVAAIGAIVARATRIPAGVAVLLAGILAPALLWSGAQAVVATCAVLLSGAALGTLFARDAGMSPLVRWVAGIGILSGAAGWLMPWPVHYAAVWAVVAVVLVLLRRHQLASDFVQLLGVARADARSAPVASSCWALLAVLVAAPAWLPARNIDDLAYHMILGSELLEFGHARLDVGTQVWAMAPWSTDLLHGLVSVMAGAQQHGPLNAWWTLATGLLVRGVAIEFGMSRDKAWLPSMLYLSLPLTSFLTGSLQTESATPAMLLALVLAVKGEAGTYARRLPVVATLAGFMLGAKLSSALLLLPVAAWLAFAWWRAFPLRALPRSVALGALACGSSYAYAGLLTGNPALPVLNGWFRAPWFAQENFVDATWQTGFGWRAPWDLVFDTARYFETTSAGAAGVVPLVFAFACIPGLVNRTTRAPVLVAMGGLVLMFSQVQYLRYLHPALALLVAAAGAALLPAGRTWGWREALLAACACLQAALIPMSSWMLAGGVLRTLAIEGSQAVSDRFVPEREVSARLRAVIQPTDRVMYLDPQRSHGAELPGQSLGTAWYTPSISGIRAKHGRLAGTVAREVHRAGANYLVIYDLPKWPEASAYLKRRNALRVDRNGVAEAYWLPPGQSPAPLRSGGEISVDRPYPVIGQIVARIGCDQPGEPVAVSWSLPSPSGPPVGLWEWVDCGPERQAVAAMQFSAGAQAPAIRLSLAPARPEKGMRLDTAVFVADIRRDFQAETSLYRWLWAPFCKLTHCATLAPRIAPLEYGPLLSRVEELGMTDVPPR